MQPASRCCDSRRASSSPIHCPRMPFTPSLTWGTLAYFSLVTVNVLPSTRATSAGSVRARKLQQALKLARADMVTNPIL